MRALVTGGTGFVGSHLVEALVARGDEVTALARSPVKAATLTPLGVRIVQGDLDDFSALREAAAGQQIVYHVAGLVHAPSEQAFFHANERGTQNVVEAATAAGAPRLVLVSSLAAAGPSLPGRPLGGDEPPRPVTAYGRSKLAGEQVVRESSLPWCIVRPPLVYGPRDVELLRIFKTAQRGFAPVFGDGRQELSTVYAPDLAQALVAVGSSEVAVRSTYYACADERCSSRDFVRAVGRAVGREVRVVPLPASLTRGVLLFAGSLARILGRSTVLNRDKAEEFLQAAWTAETGALTRDTGWRAAHDLATGLAQTVAWYRQAGWLSG